MHVVFIVLQFMCENTHSAELALVLYLVTWFGGFSSSVCNRSKEAAVGFSPVTLCVILLPPPHPPCQGSAVLQAASFEAGWEKDAVFLHLSPSWQLAVVG